MTFEGETDDPVSEEAMVQLRETLKDYDLSISSEVGEDGSARLEKEMQSILVVAAITILVVLFLTSRTYGEIPVLLLTFVAAALLNKGIIDIAQLHGVEDENEINQLRALTDKPIIKAFCIKKSEDITNAESCLADYILLDSGEGTGTVFDWKKIQNIQRPYFLAGGLSIDNVENAVRQLNPYAVDVSSGIETDGLKDKTKMAAFVAAVRKEERL